MTFLKSNQTRSFHDLNPPVHPHTTPSVARSRHSSHTMPFCSLNRTSLFKVHASHMLFSLPPHSLPSPQPLDRKWPLLRAPLLPPWLKVGLRPLPLVPSVGSSQVVIVYFYWFVYSLTSASLGERQLCESRSLASLAHFCVSSVYHHTWQIIGTQTYCRMNNFIIVYFLMVIPVMQELWVLYTYFISGHIIELSC